ncbi:FliM/FliN family flagellar motor switch protein [Sphingomonas turrisvirgatae]|uniref:Flagellar motor switch protein FliM n=1 Tax=Sphingomonas turrisvirgatae TaxID=1888892 RepID=A0A1E3LXU9_9SPHN|nr:FliM/FliN family flagellar motor switch protein [Sphingomonas turrisvirgatae]ODP37630.1 flagellar motor switch protein FliM [Sphingomonas turrisvirgatae]
MVNGASETANGAAERRERARAGAEHAPALGAAANINPFGDLHALQHLTARLAKALKPQFEPYVGDGVRCWAEPLVVQRFGDYKSERPAGLTAWLQLAMAPGRGRALIAIDGKFVFEMLDRFFGGDGEASHPLPAELTGSAETLLMRLGAGIAAQLDPAWEMLARIEFTCVEPVAPLSTPPEIDSGEAMVFTRLGVASGDAKPHWIDILYPVAALKPHTPSLTAKVIGGDPEPEPEWRNGLTRSAMALRLPVRSVLAEPLVRASTLMALRPGDVIPLTFGTDVPVMVGRQKIGFGTVGTANGRAAIKMTRFESISLEDAR